MREIKPEEFDKIKQSRLKTNKEINDDINKMSQKEHLDYMLSDGERWKGPEYLIEYNEDNIYNFPKLNKDGTRSIIKKKAKAQLVGRQSWRKPLSMTNSKWYIPKTSSYVVSQSADKGLKVYEPTASKMIFEQVLKQKVGDPYLVESMSKSFMNNEGGKRRRTKYMRKSKKQKYNKTRKNKK